MQTVRTFARMFPLLLVVMVSSLNAAEPASSSTRPTTQPAPVTYTTLTNIEYRPDATDDYTHRMCRLDVYHPTNVQGYTTVIWFHAGGFTEGERSIPIGLRNKGLAVVAVDYRLAPQAKSPQYIEDAAASVDWTMKNIEGMGGDRHRIILAGHSAGGYLALMLGLDKRWLAAWNINADSLAGIASLSGQAITHFEIRKEHGGSGDQPVIDDLAPLNHVRKDAPPILLITGDRDQEMLGRYEENAYLWRMLKVVGHPHVELHEMQGYDHNGMAEPAMPLVARFAKAEPAAAEK
jgi:acetyl esterase/lipase